jgi:hypothetical protein
VIPGDKNIERRLNRVLRVGAARGGINAERMITDFITLDTSFGTCRWSISKIEGTA